MRTPEQIKTHIKTTVAEQLPRVTSEGVRDWITARLIEPYLLRLSENSEGTRFAEFWMVTDHKDGKHYRIAYAPDDDRFGIVTSLTSGVEWYMGNYGTFKEAVENM